MSVVVTLAITVTEAEAETGEVAAVVTPTLRAAVAMVSGGCNIAMVTEAWSVTVTVSVMTVPVMTRTATLMVFESMSVMMTATVSVA